MSHTVGRIVVGVHGTPGSLQALRFAVGHARAYGATLIPVIAWQTPDSGGHRTPTHLADSLASAAEQRLLTAFDEGLGGPPSDIVTLPMVIRGPVGQVLVSVAERDSDILVIGQSNHGIVRRVLFGSPAHYCVKHARSSVILVPPTQLAVELRRQRYSRSLG